MTDDPDPEMVRRLASTLDLPVDDDLAGAVLDRYRDLRAFASDPPAPAETAVASEGHLADDEYDALLEVFEEPRTTRGEGPLAGTTVVVKDNIAVRGLRMTAGVPEFEYVPSFDATAVERLLDAGAGVLGKANLDAFAFGPAGEWSEFGDPVNPAAPGRIPGGSSSGSGAAVAGGLADAALGTDTGGSVRVPAACCGLVGVKPTHRLVSRFGFTGNAPSLDVIGPLATDVKTAALMLDAMAGPDPRDPTTVPVDPGDAAGRLEDDDRLTVGLVESGLDLASDPLAAAVRGTADRLADDADTAVEPVSLEFGDVEAAYAVIVAAEFAWYRRQRFAVRGEGFQYDRELQSALGDVPLTRHIAERVLPGALADRATDGAAYVGAREARAAFRERVDDLLADVDALLLPTMRSLPPEFGTVSGSDGKYSLTKPFNVYGGPAVSVPIGPVDGLPAGAQVVAPHFEDSLALRVARRIERAVV